MPHVVIHYTANLGPDADIGALCSALADVIVAQRDDAGKQVFPIGGTRVLAYPAGALRRRRRRARPRLRLPQRAHRPGRAPAVGAGHGRGPARRRADALRADLRSRPIGITLQIDEGAARSTTPSTATCIRCSPALADAASGDDRRPRRRAARGARSARAGASTSRALPGHDHRRRLRDPARLGGAEARRRPRRARATRSA